MSDIESYSLEITVDETMIMAHKQPFTVPFTIDGNDFQLTFQHEQSKLSIQIKSVARDKPTVFYYKLSVLDNVGIAVTLPDKGITYLNETKVTLAAAKTQTVLRAVGMVRTRLFIDPLIRVHITLSICRGMKTTLADNNLPETQIISVKNGSANEETKPGQATFPATLVKHEEKMKKSLKSSEDAASWFIIGNEAIV